MASTLGLRSVILYGYLVLGWDRPLRFEAAERVSEIMEGLRRLKNRSGKVRPYD